MLIRGELSFPQGLRGSQDRRSEKFSRGHSSGVAAKGRAVAVLARRALDGCAGPCRRSASRSDEPMKRAKPKDEKRSDAKKRSLSSLPASRPLVPPPRASAKDASEPSPTLRAIASPAETGGALARGNQRPRDRDRGPRATGRRGTTRGRARWRRRVSGVPCEHLAPRRRGQRLAVIGEFTEQWPSRRPASGIVRSIAASMPAAIRCASSIRCVPACSHRPVVLIAAGGAANHSTANASMNWPKKQRAKKSKKLPGGMRQPVRW